MRDGSLSDLGQEVGNLARQTALAYNSVNNSNASYPPPASMTGRNTGLDATEQLALRQQRHRCAVLKHIGQSFFRVAWIQRHIRSTGL